MDPLAELTLLDVQHLNSVLALSPPAIGLLREAERLERLAAVRATLPDSNESAGRYSAPPRRVKSVTIAQPASELKSATTGRSRLTALKKDKTLKRMFTAWSETEGGEVTGFWGGVERPKTGNGEPLWNCVFPVWRIEAGSYEEAMAIYNIRRGCGPYKPSGEPAPCPKCGATYYPEGSAQCWNCDHVG